MDAETGMCPQAIQATLAILLDELISRIIAGTLDFS